ARLPVPGATVPSAMASKVDFPAPLRPTSPTRSRPTARFRSEKRMRPSGAAAARESKVMRDMGHLDEEDWKSGLPFQVHQCLHWPARDARTPVCRGRHFYASAGSILRLVRLTIEIEDVARPAAQR